MFIFVCTPLVIVTLTFKWSLIHWPWIYDNIDVMNNLTLCDIDVIKHWRYSNPSPTQWSPLTRRIDLCQPLTVLQDSCKMHLCSGFLFLWAIFLFERKSFWFSSVILLNCLHKINRYWTTFETLAEIERDCKERQFCMGNRWQPWRYKEFDVMTNLTL